MPLQAFPICLISFSNLRLHEIFRFPSKHRRRNLERSFVSTINATVHTNPLRRRSFSETLFF